MNVFVIFLQIIMSLVKVYGTEFVLRSRIFHCDGLENRTGKVFIYSFIQKIIVLRRLYFLHLFLVILLMFL